MKDRNLYINTIIELIKMMSCFKNKYIDTKHYQQRNLSSKTDNLIKKLKQELKEIGYQNDVEINLNEIITVGRLIETLKTFDNIVEDEIKETYLKDRINRLQRLSYLLKVYLYMMYVLYHNTIFKENNNIPQMMK